MPRADAQRASYRLDQPMADGRDSASRTIPTFSLDSGLRVRARQPAGSAARCGRRWSRACSTSTRRSATRPRCRTSTRRPKDFNFDSIYSDNVFSGIDRVSDAHQLTAGVTTRCSTRPPAPRRCGWASRSATCSATSASRPTARRSTQRLSDVLLLGSTSLVPRWTLDAALQYSPEIERSMRSIARRALLAGAVPHRQRHATGWRAA